MRTLSIRIQAIATADDDGGHSATATAAALAAKMPLLNSIYEPAGISFLFDETGDFASIRRTVLNNTLTILGDVATYTDPGVEPPSSRDPNDAARIKLASLYPDKLVLYFSYGTEISFDPSLGHWVAGRRGWKSSGWNGAYVSLSSEVPSASTIAHEIGHYLQLHHTFGPQPANRNEAAPLVVDYVEKQNHPRKDGGLVFDGDRESVSDTPPDPGKDFFIAETNSLCGAQDSFTFPVTFSDKTRDYTLTPDRSLMMSYFNCASLPTISPQQRTRMRKALEDGIRHRLVGLRAAGLQRLIDRRHTSRVDEQITEVDVAHLADGRIVTALRSNGKLKLVAWDVADNGRDITRRGDSGNDAGPATDVHVCGLALGLVVTAVIQDDKKLLLIAWQVDAQGHIERKSEIVGDRGHGISICRVSIDYAEYVVTAFRNEQGNLQIDAWRVTPDGRFTAAGSAGGGAASRVSISPAGIDGVATHSFNSSGNCKVVLWRIGSGNIVRVGEAAAETADRVSGCGMDLYTLATAVRKDGRLQVAAWQLDDTMQSMQRQDDSGDDAGAIDDLASCRMGTELLATAVTNAGGSLQVILWEIIVDGERIARHDSDVDENTRPRSISMCPVSRDLFVTACYLGDGKMHLTAWHVS